MLDCPILQVMKYEPQPDNRLKMIRTWPQIYISNQRINSVTNIAMIIGEEKNHKYYQIDMWVWIPDSDIPPSVTTTSSPWWLFIYYTKRNSGNGKTKRKDLMGEMRKKIVKKLNHIKRNHSCWILPPFMNIRLMFLLSMCNIPISFVGLR